MTTLDEQARAHNDELRTIRTKHKQTYRLMGGVTLVVIGIWIGAQAFGGDAGFTTNLYTEGLSILVTILILNWFADRRAVNQRKQELFLQLGSQSNDFALEAKRQLEIEGWLDEALQQKSFPRANWTGMVLWDCSLIYTDFTYANMENADFFDSDLKYSVLRYANLTNVKMMGADVTRAIFSGASLTGANFNSAKMLGANLWMTKSKYINLMSADLSDAKLNDSDLSGANLVNAKLHRTYLGNALLNNADLRYSDMTQADLKYAEFVDAKFDRKTVLPDGTTWTPDTDMNRFTDPNHSEFWFPGIWRSDDPESPAYHGRS